MKNTLILCALLACSSFTMAQQSEKYPLDEYKGTLTVTGSNFSPMNLQVEVANRTLPAPKDWKFHLDLWQNPYSVARYYQVPLWSKEHFDAMRPIMKMLADVKARREKNGQISTVYTCCAEAFPNTLDPLRGELKGAKLEKLNKTLAKFTPKGMAATQQSATEMVNELSAVLDTY